MLLISKKNIFAVSAFLSLLWIVLNTIGPTQLCGGESHTSCINSWYEILFYAVVIFSILFFSLVVYKLRDEVFRAWTYFSYVWLPLSAVLIFTTDNRSGHLFANERKAMFVLMFGLYILISIIIIAWKYLATRSK